MRPINSVSTSSSVSPMSGSGIKIWKSPIPYLFGGLALMLALISVALVILACSYRKRSSQSSQESQDMKQTMPKIIDATSEPEILVIMAGNHNPTYLAKPISSSIYCTCGENQPQPTPPSTEQTLTTS